MPRMIDPSELEGDELATWYRRSPVDIEAEREAARQTQYEAFVNGIEVSPEDRDDLDAGSRGRGHAAVQDGFSDDDTGFIKARFRPPSAPPAMGPPSGLRVGPPLDAWGAAPIGATKPGFFGAHDYSPALGGYYTDLPSPLNTVRSNGTRWWELGDGTLVGADEVERIYAEQQQRLRGRDGAEPTARIRVVDRWKDGQIPQADQLEKGERELDPTCSPYGGWERDPGFGRYSARTQRYETQVTRAPGLDYVVRNPEQPPVKFDGCAVWDPRHSLLEAKGPGYADLLPKAVEWGFFGNMLRGAVDQADRQAEAARNQRIEWHVAEPGAFEFFDGATWGERPPIVPKQTPVR